MGLFDLFRNLAFFKGRSTEGLQEEDLDFQKWVQAHEEWRTRLTLMLEGKSHEKMDAQTIARDDCCSLGCWLHGNGTRFYGGEKIFTNLLQDHAAFHRSAAKIVTLYAHNAQEQAHKQLDQDFDHLSKRVIYWLHHLERQVKAV